MYSKIFKSNEISLGEPVQIKIPTSFPAIKMAYKLDAKSESDVYEKKALKLEKGNSKDLDELIQGANIESEKIIKAAEIKAQKIIEAAEKQVSERIKAIEEEARQKGFEQGYEQGYEEAKKMYEDLIFEAERIKEEANMEYNRIMSEIEADAMELVMDIARKVIGEEISVNKEHLLHLVREALGKSSNRENIVLKVSAQDYDYVVDNKEKLLSMVEGVGNLDIKRDPALKIGDCLVETPYGSIDAGVETKLAKIEDAFMKFAVNSKN
ncbi:FliH/SctL family protein [Acetivibrio clariflavus]|uniref:FliH/SctL family protein n=1 Tax=Acetivibrio clariflavus TaxID=288965 RepID=UPI00048259CB|nr:FliH/SctL family protein [Acetivibrio clariflavus]